jgi:hypothetical protein
MAGWAREAGGGGPGRAAAVVVLVLAAWGCGRILGIHDLPPERDASAGGSSAAGNSGAGGDSGTGGGGGAARGGNTGRGGAAGMGAGGTGGTGGAPSCTDGQQNGNESGVDCGGVCPKVCLGDACIPAGSPCARGACWAGICRLCGQVDSCSCEVSPANSRLYMKCYDEGRRKSWSAARQACLNEGMNLASIGGPQENAYVVSTHSSAGDFWVGGSSSGSSWVWTDGTAVGESGYTNWASGQPVLMDACLAVAMGSQTWTAADCSLPKDFLCEQN